MTPIAIVGRACVLPGALSPAELWQAVCSGRDLTSAVPQGRWGLAPEQVLCPADAPQADHCWSDRGGFVRGFEAIWNPQEFALTPEQLAGLDPLIHWTLHCAREALAEVSSTSVRRGLILGNLGFPSESMARYADQIWRGDAAADPRNRAMSGGSAALIAQALKLDAGSFCLDAACASSLYAITLACDRLNDGEADLMLAGAVQRADPLFLQQGFAALGALSKSGQSRPFHADADGLIAAEGCALFALKRLVDARRDGDTIHALIRGIGLSNDGRGRGLLVPDEAGQQRAMRAAYADAGLRPEQIGLLECHATGTPVGDAAELRSSAAVFAQARELPIASLKSNLGHLITAAGAAGLIKLIESLRHRQRAPNRAVAASNAALVNTPFRLLQQLEDWPAQTPRIAAISAFGFGGNNAHLILSEDDPELTQIASAPLAEDGIAIVGLDCSVGQCTDRDSVAARLYAGQSLLDASAQARMDQIELDLAGLRFPPKDLQQTLPQQLAILGVARAALAQARPSLSERSAALIGMEPDAEVARFGTRWRLASIDSAVRAAVVAPLEAAGVLGCMPNIPANRLSSQFDLGGPSYTLQAGAESGLQALAIARRALLSGELDSVLVGAVDLCCEPVTIAAGNVRPADAAVAMLLKRRSDAERDGDCIYALLNRADDDAEALPDLSAECGDAGAADGLLRVAASVLGLHHRRRLDGQPWLSARTRAVAVPITGHSGLSLRESVPHLRRLEAPQPRLHLICAADKSALVHALEHDQTPATGRARLVLIGTPAELPQLRARALAHLRDGAPAGSAVHFRERPIDGDVAFVFAGAGASYPGMGRELLQHCPQLLDSLGEHSQRLLTALDWSLAGLSNPSAMQQLWGASALSQLHLRWCEDVLDLRADAWIGYSSGETNALVGAGVWTDADALMAEMEASGLISHLLGGEFAALAPQWGGPVAWASWTVLAPVDEIRAALRDQSRVHLAIINADADCLIAGDAQACERVVARLGANRCLRLDYPLAVHVPELQAVAAAWLQLHRRNTQAPRSGRIYSTASGRAYAADAESCAQAILAQANQTLDLRPVIRQAWQDGVRVFIEHGPGNSFGRAIRQILGDREALVVSLDRKGQGFDSVLGVTAALLAAGVEIDQDRLSSLLAPADAPQPMQRPMRFAAHWPPLRLPAAAPIIERMQPAPRLPSVLASIAEAAVAIASASARPSSGDDSPSAGAVPTERVHWQPVETEIAWPSQTSCPRNDPLIESQRLQFAQASEAQQQYLQAMAAAQQQFLALRETAKSLLLDAVVLTKGRAKASARHSRGGGNPDGGHWIPADVGMTAVGSPELAAIPPRPPQRPNTSHDSSAHLPEPHAVGPAAGVFTVRARQESARPAETRTTPSGPGFSRAQLEIHADGRISDIFGPAFAAQDRHALQVRMPRPPLLLADRVLGIDGVAGSMGRGRIWTETEVAHHVWATQGGRLGAGVMIEAGQADLMLISWLGVDALNQGERAYRLLGCELTYHGDLPELGDTLRFDIQLDGHAAQGDVRLMFFHYECHNGGRKQLSVRQGQAGFFTATELAGSAGCLWSPELQQIVSEPRLDPPAVHCPRKQLDRTQLEAFAAGDTAACFGPGFELARTHTRSPAIHFGRMLLFDRITELAIDGGPWQRGYLRGELDITPAQWFFDGHFKNDPCMPGTLMFEACLQALALYLAACGYTLKRDGWRFQPVPELAYALQCRGQVTPSSRLLVTEIFVEERSAGPTPTVFADLLCTVDGLKAFHARRVALELVPDWPMARDIDVANDADSRTGSPVIDGFAFDPRSLLACAIGRPSEAFGPMYSRFDGPMRVARLPSPPYHFISRIAAIEGAIGVMGAGAKVVAEYEIPASVWYLDENGSRAMPFAVLLEAALQPCGWLSSYVGSALTVDSELGFRNLDGEGTVLAELPENAGTLITEVELTDVSASAGMIIENFRVRCHLGGREVYQLQTVFGFFPPEALAAQAGLPISAAQRELLQRPGNLDLDLATFDTAPSAQLRLPGKMLRMIDRIEGWWPQAGIAGLGQVRAIKHVDPSEWFFKAHFFQDPVQPGSLGLEAMLQTLQWVMLQQFDPEQRRGLRFESIAVNRPHRWKYRGQVLPHHQRVHTTLELTELREDDSSWIATGNASLWVDGQRIYEAKDLSVRARLTA